MTKNVIASLIAGAILLGLPVATAFVLQRYFGFSSQDAFNIAVYVLFGLGIFSLIGFLVVNKFASWIRWLTMKLLENALQLKNNTDEGKISFKERIMARVSQEFPVVEQIQDSGVTVYPNQETCEEKIKEACRAARKIKILTIRGAKYFAIGKSLLRELCEAKRGSGFIIEVLVRSPQDEGITEDLSRRLGHRSAERVKSNMRHVLEYLKQMEGENQNFVVKYYEGTPIFKILLFDDIMYVSPIIGAKNDNNARMLQITRGHPLFAGFENLFDDLWQNSQRPS